jgi:hypothetical protein
MKTLTNSLTIALVIGTALMICSAPARAKQIGKQTVDAYYSQRLGTSFESGKIEVAPKTHCVAWIVGMDNDSPLRALGLRPNDGILKIDGVKICVGKYKVKNSQTGATYEALPELEKHNRRTSFLILRDGSDVLEEVAIYIKP